MSPLCGCMVSLGVRLGVQGVHFVLCGESIVWCTVSPLCECTVGPLRGVR